MLRESGYLAEDRHDLRPLVGDDGTHRITVASVADRGREKIREGQLAEATRKLDPTGDRAGYRHRVPARPRHGVVLREALGRPAGRRASRRGQPAERATVPENGEEVAAEAVAARLDYRERDRR